jgi:hypothetical protein
MNVHPSIEGLLSEIDAFSSKRGLSPTRFGKLALNDEGLVHELRRGRWPRPETVDRIRAFMKAQRVAA